MRAGKLVASGLALVAVLQSISVPEFVQLLICTQLVNKSAKVTLESTGFVPPGLTVLVPVSKAMKVSRLVKPGRALGRFVINPSKCVIFVTWFRASQRINMSAFVGAVWMLPIGGL